MAKSTKEQMVEVLKKYGLDNGKLKLDLSNTKDEKVDDEFYSIAVGEKDVIAVYVYDDKINLSSSKTQNTIASGDNPISLDTLEILLMVGTESLTSLDTEFLKNKGEK